MGALSLPQKKSTAEQLPKENLAKRLLKLRSHFILLLEIAAIRSGNMVFQVIS